MLQQGVDIKIIFRRGPLLHHSDFGGGNVEQRCYIEPPPFRQVARRSLPKPEPAEK